MILHANLYIYRWRLRAMVNFVYQRRKFTNAKGDGEIASWDLKDDTGRINMIAFNENAIMFSEKFEMNKVICCICSIF